MKEATFASIFWEVPVGGGGYCKNIEMFQGSDQLFITTGNSKSSEIIAVTHSTRCIAPADYPLRVEGAVGTFVEERPLICGGRSSIEDYHDDCFHYNIYNNRSVRKVSLHTQLNFEPVAVGAKPNRRRRGGSRPRPS